MNSGVYAIQNTVNGRRYIGSTGKLNERWGQHKSSLNRQVHCNSYLQHAWNKYLENSFEFQILETCPPSILLEREEFWIKQLQSHKDENGYNLCKTPRASRLGCKARPETIEKMKSSLSGERHPMWGKHLKNSTKEKLSQLQLGISKPKSGRKKSYSVLAPDGSKVEIVGLRKFCREHGLVHSMFWRMATGKQPEYKGWKNIT